jgi:hypothetical protein
VHMLTGNQGIEIFFYLVYQINVLAH